MQTKQKTATIGAFSSYKHFIRKKIVFLAVLSAFVLLFLLAGLLLGSSGISLSDSFFAIFGKGEAVNVRIVQKIRLPRVLAGLCAGMGLALSGLLMQSCLDNPMASPGTLGVSNAAVLGANVAILIISGGMVSTNGNSNWNLFNPYAVSAFAFLFAILSTLLVLGLSRIRNFSPDALILSGVALSALFQAITTLIQYFATDVQLSSAVYWTFGDLGRASFRDVYLMLGVFLVAFLVSYLFRYQLNALTMGEEQAKGLGVRTSLLRFVLLLAASLLAAVSISFLGIIGFVGLMAPHIVRRIIGGDHRFLIPGSCLMGALILLVSDTLARALMQGISLPVGAVTAILGAPFFLFLILSGKKERS